MGAVARKGSIDQHPTAMAPRLGWWLRALGQMFFRKVAFDRKSEEIVREASRRGSVVYVMRDRSYIGYLFFNWAYLVKNLPLAQFVNGFGSFLLHPLRTLGRLLLGRGLPARGVDGFRETVARGDGALLFLRRPPTLTERDPDFKAQYVRELIRLQRGQERPILVVPQLLLWTRDPERYRKSLVDVVFGEPDAPGRIRGTWLFLRNHRRAFAKVAEPVDLKELIERFPTETDEVLAKKVRWMVLHYLSRERQVVLGPILKSPRRLKAEVMRSRRVRDLLVEVAAAEQKPAREIDKRAKKILNEIAADINLRVIRWFARVLDPVFGRLYDGIEFDAEGLQRVREAMRRTPVVLVPCHRSHVDYLLIQYLCYRQGLMPPHVAAGKNLSFWPLGSLFRRCGAFFLRRSFRGDQLYTGLFRAYVHKLLREGLPLEFFIEGGRSRSGKMLFPKLGFLGMVVDAILEGQVRDVTFVPINIGYQKIIEERSYTQELMGAKKEKEDLKGLLAVPKVLRSRYGRVYVDFAEPILLSSFATARGWQPDQALSPQARQDLIRSLGMRLTFDIDRVGRVVPSALTAAALLGEGKRGMARERLMEAIHRLRDLLRLKHVRLPKAMSGPSAEVVIDESLRLLQGNKLIEIRNQGEIIVYAVPESARLRLDYYKNGMLHGVVSEAIVACALRGLADAGQLVRTRVRDRARRISHILKYEFIFRPGVPIDTLFDDAVANLEALGYVRQAEGKLEIVPEFRDELRLLCGLVENFVEAYAATARGLRGLLDGPKARKVLQAEILEKTHEDFLTGGIRRFESCSKLIFENALRYFEDEGVLLREGEEVQLQPQYASVEPLVELEAAIDEMAPRPE